MKLDLLVIFCLLYGFVSAAMEDEYIVWPLDSSTPESRLKTAATLASRVRQEIIETIRDEKDAPEFWVLHKPGQQELANVETMAEVSSLDCGYRSSISSD